MTDAQTALVTGATGGLGRAFAHALAADGYHLVLTARSDDALRGLADELPRPGDVTCLAADLSTPEGIAKVTDHLSRHRVDLLVNNAGFATYGKVAEADLDREVEEVTVNVTAVVALTTAALPQMVERRSGGILNVASVAGAQPVPEMATYGASKAFVVSYSHAVAEEVARKGVHVTALCPGPVRTGFFDVAGSEKPMVGQIVEADEVVRQGLAALEKGTRQIVPGWQNKVSSTAASLAPRSLAARLARRQIT